jgi:hypothetical protein
MVASMIGVSDGRPYLAASNARSIASMPGATTIRPRRSASFPLGGREGRRPGEYQVDFGHHAWLADVASSPAHRWSDRDRIDELDQGAPGVGA